MKKETHSIWYILAVTLILIGAMLRFYVAWLVQYIPSRDAAIPMLMAKHMAEGLPPTVFYYGQAYMGSLEPMISALFVLFLGPTAFANCAGTALLGASVLVLVFMLARDIAGPRAGCFAVATMMTTSNAMFYYSTHPRGGYMTLLTLGLLTVLFANRFSMQALHRQTASTTNLMLAGFFGGLGWWNNQMMIVYLVVAAIVVLPATPFVFRRGTFLWAALAFIVGSLPWWIWNALNDWGTFSFSSSFGQLSFRNGIMLFFQTVPSMLGYTPLDQPLNQVRLIALIACLCMAFFTLCSRWRHEGWRSPSAIPILSMFLTVTVMALFYANSHFARLQTPRYIIPILPACAVLCGIAIHTVWDGRRMVWRGAALALLVAVIPSSTYFTAAAVQSQKQQRTQWEQVNQLADFLQPISGGVILGDFLMNWINIATQEKAIVVNAPDEAYAPYNRRATIAKEQVFLNNFRNIRDHLMATQANWEESMIAGYNLTHAITPPPDSWNYLSRTHIDTIADLTTQTDLTETLTDLNLETEASISIPPDRPYTLEWKLTEPRDLCGLVLMNPGTRGLTRVRIELQHGSNRWVSAGPEYRLNPYFWSGPRLYIGGLAYQQEVRFSSPAEGVTGLRLHMSSAKEQDLQLSEFLLLEKQTDENTVRVTTKPWPDAELERLGQFIRDQQIGRMYAPRWITESLHQYIPDDVALYASSYLFRTVHQIHKQDSPEAPYLDLAHRTLLICDRRDADRSRRLLDSHTLSWQEHQHNGYLLFVVEPLDPTTAIEMVVPLFWTDRGLFRGDGNQYTIQRAAALFQAAQQTPNPDLRIQRLEQCLRLAPDHEQAFNAYVQIADDVQPDIASQRTALQPDIPAQGRFSHGLTFEGVTVEKDESANTLDLTYFWRFKPSASIHRWSVFVHFRQDGRIVFQDDHNLTEHMTRQDIAHQPFPRVFRVTRSVRVPPELQSDVDMHLGLVNPMTGERGAVRSRHELHRKTMVMPTSIPVP
jgi:4-amino-4-deoxy-L-arabinose transferase-like glycosyltransferase